MYEWQGVDNDNYSCRRDFYSLITLNYSYYPQLLPITPNYSNYPNYSQLLPITPITPNYSFYSTLITHHNFELAFLSVIHPFCILDYFTVKVGELTFLSVIHPFCIAYYFSVKVGDKVY